MDKKTNFKAFMDTRQIELLAQRWIRKSELEQQIEMQEKGFKLMCDRMVKRGVII
jgi:hypothetical protein